METDRRSSPASKQTAVGRTEIIISTLLRTGVVLSLLTIVAGVVLMFVHHPEYLRSSADLTRLTAPGAAFPQSLAEVASGLRDFRGQSIVVVGLLMLIATPIFRVAVSVLVFAVERDWIYVLITAAALFVLLLSFWLGKAG